LKKAKSIKRGFQPRAEFIKDKDGNLIGDREGIVNRWAEYFSELLNESSQEGVEEIDPVEGEDETPQLPPTIKEVQDAIKSMKNNKAPGEDGIVAEFWKAGGAALEERMHQLITEIWIKEEMPANWSVAIICPLHKKNDILDCANYRGISLLDVAYKIFAKVLNTRLHPIAESLLGEYQCGFRKGRSTIDQIFALRQILEKCYEYNVNVHQLYIDFRKAYDTVRRGKVIEALKSFGITPKLVRLVRMTLVDTTSMVKVDGQLSPPFRVKVGVRQGGVLSATLFNLALESAMRQIPGNPGGTVFNRLLQSLAYADDIAMIARTTSALEEGYTALETAIDSMGLQVSVEKTKYMLSTRSTGNVQQPNSITLNGKQFERCSVFKYMGTTAVDSCALNQEIKARISAGNRCYFVYL